MRRPVKPFVTEYKGPSRRAAPHAVGNARRSGEDGSPFSSPGETLSRNGVDTHPVHHGEDAYEAALRAADALFAPAAPKAEPARMPHVVAESSAAMSPPASETAASVFASPAPSGPETTLDVKGASHPGAEAESAPRGRILRVLDEPPAPGLAELEAERAPKRRGRKPGSKNKPKPAPSPVSANEDASPRARAMDSILSQTVPPPTMAATDASGADQSGGTGDPANIAADDEPDDDDFGFDWDSEPARAPTAAWVPAPRQTPARAPAPRQTPARAPAAAAADASAVAARAEPYGWVRTKLAPGERWKRRLPKVCW